MIFDTHCHVQFNSYKDDYEEVIKRCKEKGVILNTVGTQKTTSKLAVEFAEKYENVYATIGIHPIHVTSTEVDEEETHFQSREEEFDEKYYDELASHKKVIAVGECGLELFHLPEDANKEEILEKQKQNFFEQYNFAKKHNLPLVIHIRDAYEEMADFLQELKNKTGEDIRGVVHCYSSNWQNAKRFLDLGLYIGFTGIITFPERKTNPEPHFDLLEVVKNIPLDKMLIETDAPYLAPQKYRGQRCEPWMVEEVGKKIAELKNLSSEEVFAKTLENSKKLFNI